MAAAPATSAYMAVASVSCVFWRNHSPNPEQRSASVRRRTDIPRTPPLGSQTRTLRLCGHGIHFQMDSTDADGAAQKRLVEVALRRSTPGTCTRRIRRGTVQSTQREPCLMAETAPTPTDHGKNTRPHQCHRNPVFCCVHLSPNPPSHGSAVSFALVFQHLSFGVVRHLIMSHQNLLPYFSVFCPVTVCQNDFNIRSVFACNPRLAFRASILNCFPILPGGIWAPSAPSPSLIKAPSVYSLFSLSRSEIHGCCGTLNEDSEHEHCFSFRQYLALFHRPNFPQSYLSTCHCPSLLRLVSCPKFPHKPRNPFASAILPAPHHMCLHIVEVDLFDPTTHISFCIPNPLEYVAIALSCATSHPIICPSSRPLTSPSAPPRCVTPLATYVQL